ncbi:MAG TPA: hypothetical protein VNW92_08565 [Polyangiaceae bacterium]|nr:hypothetical protein [Polyangiaceae bacterium]
MRSATRKRCQSSHQTCTRPAAELLAKDAVLGNPILDGVPLAPTAPPGHHEDAEGNKTDFIQPSLPD